MSSLKITNYSRSQVVKAGKLLRKEAPSTDNSSAYSKSMDVLGFWRSVNARPLQIAYKELVEIASKIDSKVVVAKREKRARSIIEKLKREKTMSLVKMQDIGGCRAIVRTPKDVRKVAAALKNKKHVQTKHNYLKRPKADGYRGFHLIGNYNGGSCGELAIEFQVRTRIQHAWATAGEITELFTSKSIKHLDGDTEWKSFYKRLADLFDLIDNEIVTRDFDFDGFNVADLKSFMNTNLNEEGKKIANSLKRRAQELKVIDRFVAYASSLKFANDRLAQEQLNDGYILVHIDTSETEIKLTHFSENQLLQAQQEYIDLEKRIATKPDELVVLISSQAVGGIKQAYPNYFADSQLFMKLFKSVI